MRVTAIVLWQGCLDECGMCGAEVPCRHAVAWWCGPRREEIGSRLPNGEEVGGMAVCAACHDAWYGPEETWD